MSAQRIIGLTDGGSVYSTRGTYTGQWRRMSRSLHILAERVWRAMKIR